MQQKGEITSAQTFDQLTFVLPLSANGISIDGNNKWGMANVNFGVNQAANGNLNKDILEEPMIFVANGERKESNYLLGMCGDWNGDKAQYKIGYQGNGGKENLVTNGIQDGVNP